MLAKLIIVYYYNKLYFYFLSYVNFKIHFGLKINLSINQSIYIFSSLFFNKIFLESLINIKFIGYQNYFLFHYMFLIFLAFY